MEILYKTGVELNQLQDKLRFNGIGLELHLNGADVQDELSTRRTLHKLKSVDLNYKVIHIPFDVKSNIEDLSEGYNSYIENSYILADKLGVNQLVIHTERTYEEITKDRNSFKNIKANLKWLNLKFPGKKLAIENLSLLSNSLKIMEGYVDTNIKLVRLLNKELNTDRFGITIDTCHYIASNWVVKNMVGFKDYSVVDVNEVIESNLDILQVVHLACAKEEGRGPNHGTDFTTEKELNLLKDLISEINKSKGVYTVLEVQDPNYSRITVAPNLHRKINKYIGVEQIHGNSNI